jgi:hypothetical protein
MVTAAAACCGAQDVKPLNKLHALAWNVVLLRPATWECSAHCKCGRQCLGPKAVRTLLKPHAVVTHPWLGML